MTTQAFRIAVGVRVRHWFGGSPHYGTVTHVADVGPWVKVQWDRPLPGLFAALERKYLEDANAPLPPEPELADDAPF